MAPPHTDVEDARDDTTTVCAYGDPPRVADSDAED